jgi:2-iminobutanoate/2-iminopropanoate deaminase
MFANISAVLETAGKSFDDVMKTTVYLAVMKDFGAMNTVYARYFQTPYPARTTFRSPACRSAPPSRSRSWRDGRK